MEWMKEWRALIGAVPMVTMAQSAANWRNTLTVDCIAFTHTYINTVTTMWCEAPAQLLLLSACLVFSCFRNPHNLDKEYRIFIVHTWAQHFWLRGKNSQMFLVLIRKEWTLWELEYIYISTRHIMWHHRHTTSHLSTLTSKRKVTTGTQHV